MKVKITVSNSRHFSMYVVFFITPNIWLKLKDICITIQTCGMHVNFYPFSKFRGLMPAKWPLFLAFANSRLPLKKFPSRKWVRAWYTFWSGVGAGDVHYCKRNMRHFIKDRGFWLITCAWIFSMQITVYHINRMLFYGVLCTNSELPNTGRSGIRPNLTSYGPFY